MVPKSITALLSVVATLLFASGCVVGMPYINLPWYLQDVVATTLIGREAYVEIRSIGPNAEIPLRERTEPTANWIMPSPSKGNTIKKTGCDDFTIRTFADWQSAIAQDTLSVDQWREVFHGASVLVDYSVGFRGLRRVQLAAAVLSPGIPKSAFVSDGTGGLQPEYFDAAATFKGAGFDNMREALLPLDMSLRRNETCVGYELYIWEFRK